MPAPATITEFLELVQKSGVVENAKVQAYLEKLKAKGTLPTENRKLAGMMVRDAILTYFQAEQLLQGKWKRFSIGKYRVLERLGSGGMGQVFLCEHKLMRRRVAVKVLPTAKAQDTASLERFYREARAVAALDHPNLVRAYDIDSDEGLHFLVMEFVDGRNLQDLVSQIGPLDVTRACHYIYGTAVGLQYAHEMGIIHRDIKPGNVLIDRNGVVKVLDMGLARFFNDEDDGLTRKHDETVLGTADYLAPEQAVDSHTVTIRADLYSLGGTFHYLLTGKSPFPEGTVTQKLLWHQTKDPKPVKEYRPEVPDEIAEIVKKLLAKEPDHRFQTPGELLAALQPWVQTPISPPSDSELPKLSPAAIGNGSGIRPSTGNMLTGGSPLSANVGLSTSNSSIPVIQVPSMSSQGSLAAVPTLQQLKSPTLLATIETSSATEGTHEAGVWESLASDTNTTRATDTNTVKLSVPKAAKARKSVSFKGRILLYASSAFACVSLVAALLLILFSSSRSSSPQVAEPSGPRKLYVTKGTSPDPSATFNRVGLALARANPGDTVVLLDERYEDWLVIGAKMKSQLKDLVIEGGLPDRKTVWAAPSSGHVRAILEIQGLEHLTVRGITFDASGRADACISVTGATAALTFEDLTLRGASAAPLLISSSNPSDHPLQIQRVRSIADHGALAGVLMTSRGKVPVSNVRIVENRIEGQAAQVGIQLDGAMNGIEIRHNRIFNTSCAVQIGGSLDPNDPYSIQLIRNTFHTVSDAGLRIAEGTLPAKAEVHVDENYFAFAKFLARSVDGKWPGLKVQNNARNSSSQEGNVSLKSILVAKDDLPQPNLDNDVTFLRYPTTSALMSLPPLNRPVGAPPIP